MRLRWTVLLVLCFSLPVFGENNSPRDEGLPAPFQGENIQNAAEPNIDAIRRAVNDHIETYGDQYPKGQEFLKRLGQSLTKQELRKLRYEALVENNPVLDFGKILLVKRSVQVPAFGLPSNYENNFSKQIPRGKIGYSNSSLKTKGFDDVIETLDIKTNELQPLYRHNVHTLITDLDLDYDADKLMFSAVGDNGRWQLFEIGTGINAGTRKQLTRGGNDIDFYDSCYLPDGRIITTCNAPMTGVPCVAGHSYVANLFLLTAGADGTFTNIRQLAFDQEHNWSPAVLNDGKILYTRWEYADIPHSNSRLLFSCNPDGTQQTEYYGSNSFWPTAVILARPVPHHPTKIAAIVSGHHDHGRLGELVIFDPAVGRHEADGAIQKIPGWGKKVIPHISDGLTRYTYPQFTHPYPLSEKYYLVSARPQPDALFGIYLVDVFDNMILLKELPEFALFEPVPLKKRPKPPAIHDRVDLTKNDANVFCADIYSGPGLAGIPRGTVKALRIFTYHYAYRNTGGLLGSVGQDGPWDVRAVLGTVPVEDDGSFHFRTPANLPIGIQPLDKDGQALALMRSWMTAMPGENLHCNGCHEDQNTVPPPMKNQPMAIRKPAVTIQAYIPKVSADSNPKTYLDTLNVRGFSFAEEVQPVLDKYCISCHNGEKTAKTAMVNGKSVGTALDGKPFAIDLSGNKMVDGWSSQISGNCGVRWGGKWTVAYDNLQRFVRRSGIESDIHLLNAAEFSANTTELVQILKAGHYGVQLSGEAWERLYTWIDMNCPYHGNWNDANADSNVNGIGKRRIELAKLYGADLIDVEGNTVEPRDLAAAKDSRDIVKDKKMIKKPLRLSGSFTVHQLETQTISFGGQRLTLVKIPAKKPFWMSTTEITNAQFRCFDPHHDSKVESRNGYQFGARGYDVNKDELPVVRVSWNEAKAFCDWLTQQSNRNVKLPTEEQWEFACKAGAETPFWYGGSGTDFSEYANMADINLKDFVSDTSASSYAKCVIVADPNPFDDRYPKDERFNDGAFLQAAPGKYKANPFGLFDMHGNVAEWTSGSECIVKGGSYCDRPYRCTAEFRLTYPAYQKVYNVGFRIIAE